ncbi:MAG: hypothetical protein FJ026_09910 [Chloroflexi bacterium]|nr:hypothetical protein [Chloroflexota bacterium]
MSQLEKLLRATEKTWPELPDLIGQDWPGFADQLTGYLKQLKEAPDQEPVICALILALFARYPEAHRRLVETIAEQESQEPLMTRGLREFFTRETPATSVTRYTDIACPRRVWIKTPRVSVVVRLTVQRQEFSAAVEELKLREDLPVRVRVGAAGFEVLNTPEQETAIMPGKDSPALVFDLRPRQVGPTRVNFDFFQADNPVGTASVPVEITAFEVSAVSEPRPGQALRTEPQATPPDYMLFIAFERFQEQPALVFTLSRAGEVGRTFHPVPLQGGDPLTQATRLYEQITALTDSVEPTSKLILGKERRLPAADIDRQLKKFGQNLWRDLVPEDLKAVYAAEAGGLAG